jgi:hypothetical protein
MVAIIEKNKRIKMSRATVKSNIAKADFNMQNKSIRTTCNTQWDEFE